MKKWVVFTSIMIAIIAGVIVYTRFNTRGGVQNRLDTSAEPLHLETKQPSDSPFDYDAAYATLDKESRDALKSMEAPEQTKQRQLLIYGWSHKNKWSGDSQELEPMLKVLKDTKLPDFNDPNYFDDENLIAESFAFLTQAWVQAGAYPTQEDQCLTYATRIFSSSNTENAMTAKLSALLLLDIIRRMRPDDTLPQQSEKIYQQALKNGHLKHELKNQLDLLRDDAKKHNYQFPGE